MALISFSPIQDGVTGVNAAATNTPLSTIYNDYNGNITDANIASGAAIAFSKISGGSATALTAWSTYVPTLTNVTTGNGTITGRYVQIGKTVHFYVGISFGSTTTHAVGQVSFSLPVTSISYTNYSTVIGQGAILSGSAYPVFASWLTTTTAELDTMNVASTYPVGAGVTSSVPTSLGTGHAGTSWYILGSYEAA